ncbi:MAG: large subunit ribosomal protein L25 [Candidatus Promineifilaceae bacterium]|jgi:large subunit ribosomal protein L25
MAETESKIVAENREANGKQLVRKLRNAGRLPGVLSRSDGTAVEVSMDHHSFEMSLRGHGLEGRLLDVEVSGEDVGKFVLKDIQRHPVSGTVLHVDFVEVVMGHKMRSTTQLSFDGTPKGTEAGGVVEILLRDVEIECLPKNLIETLHIDISDLDIGDALTVGDIILPDDIEITTSADIAIISVSAPRVKTAAEEDAEKSEVAEPAEEKAE